MSLAQPPDEPQRRLRIVDELGMRGDVSTPALQAIVALGRELTGWPIAAISLVGDRQQWFVAVAGLAGPAAGPAEDPHGLCSLAVAQSADRAEAHFEIDDALRDPRSGRSRMVTGEPHLRAYAGLTLRVGGATVGMLSVAHDRPGRLEAERWTSLRALATTAEALLEARLQERRSRRQEARVRGASRAGSDWLWETDAAGVVTWVSASVEAHTGEPPSSTVGRMAQAYNRPCDDEHRASYDAYLQARSQQLPFRDAVAERETPRGVLIVSLSGDPVFNSTGCFMGYRGAARDITDLIALRRRAQRAELLLRGSVEHSRAAMMITDPSGEIIVSNAAWRAQVARYLDDPPDCWPALARAMAAAGAYPEAEGRTEAFVAWQLALADQGPGLHEMRVGDTHQLVSAQRLDDGSVVHLAIDITEHRRAQSALLDQQLRLAAVLRALPDLWFVLDPNGRYLECSAETHPALLTPFQQVRGSLIEEALPQVVATPARRAFEDALRTGAVQRIEYELSLPVGVRQFEARMSPMGGERVLQLVRDISELRALERNVHLMQRAFEAPGALPMSVVDATQPELPLIYVNAAFEAMSGRSRAQLLGKNCRVLQGSDRNQPALTELRRALSLGQGCVVQVRNYRADGAQFINELHIAPVRDGSGRLTHFVGVQHDVTERSRAEQQLQVREALYRSVTSAISDGLLVVNPNGAVVTVNPAACRLLGSRAETIVGGSLYELGYVLLEADGTPLGEGRDPVTEVLRGGPNVAERVLALRHPDGRQRTFSVSAHRLRAGDDQGDTACVVTFRDITEQREAERGMAQAESRWRFALEEAGDGLLDYDADTGRTFFSPRWKAMLGYTHHEIGNALQEWSHRVHPEDYPRVIRAVRRYIGGELPEYRSEHRLRHKNGSWVWVLDRAKIVERRADGSPRRIVGIHTDITRMKAAESALRDKRAADLASAAKSEFLSRMSHEMRTPLNAVIGFAQLLQMRGDAGRPVPVAQYSEHILQSGRHLLGLVNDVLDLQQVEAGRMSLAPQAVDLLEALEAASRLVEPAAQARRVRISLEVEPGLNVWADARRLQQVLLNLMSNGVKYNQIGGSLICQARSAHGERCVVTIEDTGEGLTEEQMARLFQPFERLGRETSSVEGSGLGLVISRALVREMDGMLTMSSRLGVGSCVRVELPVSAMPGEQSRPVESPPPPAMPSAPLRMLYVEDNRLNALLFEEAIKMRGGVELRVVEDGPDAIELLQAWCPDVLVLDAHLPSMSGYEVLSRLRQVPRFAHTPAFMCSADALPDELQRAREAGFAGYWSKPIDIAQVMKELDALPAPSAAPLT